MSLRVLVINDEPDLLEACCLVLESAGYTVETLSRARKAVDRVAAFHPDLVVLDWVLTETNGDVVLRELRNCYGTDLRIVIMSALPDLRPRALELGADDFLQKPFNDDQLVSVVASHVRQPRPGHVEKRQRDRRI